MLETIKRLLSPEYLVVPEPGPLGSSWILYGILGLLFAACLAKAVWVLGWSKDRTATGKRTWAWLELWISLAGLVTVAGRFLGWPGWSARIWPLSLALLAVAGLAAYRFRAAALAPWLAVPCQILALVPVEPAIDDPAGPFRPESSARFRPTAQVVSLLGLAVHMVGIGLVVRARYGLPLWLAPLVLVAVLLPQAPLLARRRRPSLLALTPLLAAYGVTLLWLLYQTLGVTVIAWQGMAFPNPMVSLFYVDGIILAAAALSILGQLAVIQGVVGRPGRLWRWAQIGMLAVTLVWAGIVYFGSRTHGATASDPYAYAQMGVDLAEHGTFLHRYSLFQQVIPLNIAWAPLQPVGYHIPRNGLGDCPSVWPTGASVLLAAGYKLLGEVGLYVTTPFVALLALAAAWALVQEVLRNEPRAARYVSGALTVALLATSPEFVDRLLVPMADAAAQLFTTLTLLFALQAVRQTELDRRRSAACMVLAGIAFAWAYWVRHTQLLLALPVCMAIGLRTRETKAGPRTTAWLLLTFFGAALIFALPDILYRWRAFGGPLATETTELPAMGLEQVGPVAWQLLRDMLVAGEWGYLFPLAIYGSYRLARQHRRKAIVLGSGFAVILLVHLTYRFLRLRDLLSLFPLVDLAVAYGAVELVRLVRQQRHNAAGAVRLGRALLPVVMVAGIVLSLALSRWAMVDDLWKPGWASFGYMRAEQRSAFDRLAQITPPEAVIGASLNAGAVMLYSERDAIRPYDSWTDDEWAVFLGAMEQGQRPVYLLDDGAIMAQFIRQEGARRRLTPVEALSVPLFDAPDRQVGWLYRLEWQP